MKMKKIILYILIFSLSLFVLAALSPSYELVYSQNPKLASNILASGIVIGVLIICFVDFIFFLDDSLFDLFSELKEFICEKCHHRWERRKLKPQEDVENISEKNESDLKNREKDDII